MALDPQRIRFKGKVIVAALACGASVDSADAAPFVEALYSEWSSTGAPISSVEAWLQSRLAGEFQSVNAPPTWVEEEPSWPFLAGQPMTFISQSRVGHLSPGEVVYLFGSRRERGTGFSMVYRVVSQVEGQGREP